MRDLLIRSLDRAAAWIIRDFDRASDAQAVIAYNVIALLVGLRLSEAADRLRVR